MRSLPSQHIHPSASKGGHTENSIKDSITRFKPFLKFSSLVDHRDLQVLALLQESLIYLLGARLGEVDSRLVFEVM